MDFYIGVDIGGTSIKIAFIKEDGEIITKWEIPTNKNDQGKHIPQEITQSILQRLNALDLSLNQAIGLGAGAPGYTDVEKGIVFEAVNIGWKNFYLKDELEHLLNIPVFVLNDANMAVLGELWLGAGQDTDNCIAVTLGTGVGGGIVVNGQVINGVNGTGGEIGHIIVTPNEGPLCNCGRRGCIETYVSATGIANQGLEAVQKGEETSLTHIFKESQTLTSKQIFEEAQKGDKVSNQIIEKTASMLSIMLANVVAVVNPGVIIIGGGVSKAGEQLLTPLKKAFKKYCLDHALKACEIKLARLGNDAGVIGGAYYIKQNSAKS